jgi:hypothetical protein
MEISRRELDERLRRAADLRRTLRRATRELAEAGAAILGARERKPLDDAGSR